MLNAPTEEDVDAVVEQSAGAIDKVITDATPTGTWSAERLKTLAKALEPLVSLVSPEFPRIVSEELAVYPKVIRAPVSMPVSLVQGLLTLRSMVEPYEAEMEQADPNYGGPEIAHPLSLTDEGLVAKAAGVINQLAKDKRFVKWVQAKVAAGAPSGPPAPEGGEEPPPTGAPSGPQKTMAQEIMSMLGGR